MAKVLCKPRFEFPRFEIPRFEIPHFETGRSKMGQFKSARIGPHSKFQKYFHDWSAPIMDMLLKFGIGADSSTFGLPRFTTPHYQMGFFKMGFAENLGHKCFKGEKN